MDVEQFKIHGKEMIEYICKYLKNIGERRVTPDVSPGYLKELLPDSAPELPEEWKKIMEDVEEKIMPGVTHWQHPGFHAYFPSGNSFPSILGDMLSDAIGCIGFSWVSSPACTELETIVLDWLGKAIGLPEEFLSFSKNSNGGGVIQSSASECVLVTMLAARTQALERLKKLYPFLDDCVLLSKLIAYTSDEAHSCVHKAAMISFVKLRVIESDKKGSLRGAALLKAMQEDINLGLVPFYVLATLGTTSSCSFDNLQEIGPACKQFQAWLHIDAAYAGNAFICPELKYILSGIEHADSFSTNSNKWLLVNFDCSTMWIKDQTRLTSAMAVDPLYLQHSYSRVAIDYRHWGVPLSRRFRSLKLWFVLRSFGISGLQNYIRNHINLAKKFEALVLGDRRFEVCNDVKLGLVCFRLKSSDESNKKLLKNINASGKLYLVPAEIKSKYVIRFCVVAQNCNDNDIAVAWDTIKTFAEDILKEHASNLPQEEDVDIKDKTFVNTWKEDTSSLLIPYHPETVLNVSIAVTPDIMRSTGIQPVNQMENNAIRPSRQRKMYVVERNRSKFSNKFKYAKRKA